MTQSTALENVNILVTRPAQQADKLCEMIKSHGGNPVRFPVLEILDIDDNSALTEQVSRLAEFDIALFVSANAVTKAMNVILSSHQQWPEHVKIAAIGRSSARELTRTGHKADITPKSRFNSEALLELPELQNEAIQGKRIIIFRGGRGRELLGNTLTQRGANIEYAEAYRRGRPPADTSRIQYLWSRGELDIVTVTSNESLHNLFEMVGKLGRMWIVKTPLLVASERAQTLAEELSFRQQAIVADDATDESMISALIKWNTQRQETAEKS